MPLTTFWIVGLSSLRTAKSPRIIFSILPKRFTRLMIMAICAFIIFFMLYPRCTIPYPKIRLKSPGNLPPLYEEYKNYEDRVSELNLKTLGTASDKYVYVSNHAMESGWGNIMQELVFSTLLASGSGRGFVWDEYIWNANGSQYSDYNGKYIPSRIPLSVMIAGHILGLPASPGLPPSISKRVYEQICPQSDRLYLTYTEIKNHLGLPNLDNLYWTNTGQEVLDAWLSLLSSPAVKNRKCVEITGPQIFTIWILHNPRLHSLVNTLFNAPVLLNWGWSKLVKGLFLKNLELFTSRLGLTSSGWLYPTAKHEAFVLTSDILQNDISPLPLLVLHLRRGDYEEHCRHLTKYHSTYVGMVSLPEFEERDSFVSPNSSYSEDDIPENVSQFYSKHCYPDVAQIRQRVREVLHDYETFLSANDRKKLKLARWGWLWRYDSTPLVKQKVKKVYIMTNGKRDWLREVSEALLQDAKQSGNSDDWEFTWSWEGIGSSRDLNAGWEEKPVLQLVDMYVGQRAELFIGNGFSTLTSNLVMLRKHNGLHPIQTRFW